MNALALVKDLDPRADAKPLGRPRGPLTNAGIEAMSRHWRARADYRREEAARWKDVNDVIYWHHIDIAKEYEATADRLAGYGR